MKSLYFAEWNTFIRYQEIYGKGRILVYLAGLGMPSADQFLPVVSHPDMAGYHSLLIDFIGSGCSAHSKEFDYSIENHAQTIAGVLDEERVGSCSIVGHSMGGTVGIMLAILRPDLVSQLIAAEANVSPGGGEATRRITSHSESEYVKEAHRIFLIEIREAEIEGDNKAAFINAAWSKSDPFAIYKSSLALVELDAAFIKQFQKLSIPRTFIYGEESFPSNQNQVQPDAPDPDELKRFGIDIAIVPNAGHAMMFDNLDGFVSALKQALRSSNLT